MDSLKNNTSLSFSLFLINCFFYFSILSAIAYPVYLTFGLIYPESDTPLLRTSVQLNEDELSLSHDKLPTEFEVVSGTVSVPFSYLAKNHSSEFVILGITGLAFLGVTIYGLWLFLKVLKSVERGHVFEENNADRIYTISIMLLIAFALKAVGNFTNLFTFADYFGMRFSFFFEVKFGLLLGSALTYILSLILRKAQEQYEEQKLTV